MDGKTLRYIRIYMGKTQEAFAADLGTSVTNLGMIECGRRKVTDSLRMKIAQVFEVDEDFINAIQRYKSLNDL